MISKQNWLAIILTILSFIVLIPGITQETLSIKVGSGPFVLVNQSYSILSLVENLYDTKNYLVSFLVLLFSVIVPVTKGVGLLSLFFIQHAQVQSRLYRVISAIGKWSMADVFILAVYMGVLASKGNQYMDIQLQAGFFYFLTYCIVSLGGIQCMKIINLKKNN